MSVPAAISVVTLGVTDVPASTRFYQALGFELSPASVEGDVSFFKTAGGLLAVWSADDLRADAGVEPAPEPGRFRGVSLAINVADRAAVDTAIASAQAAGAEIVKPPFATDWGGYLGYFTDPDGHLWEVAHNPGFPLAPDGTITIP